jgi:hypothetical protein
MAKRRNRHRRYPREDLDPESGYYNTHLHVVENDKNQTPWVGRNNKNNKHHFYRVITSEKIFQISDTIFNGKYYCVGDDK